MKNQILQLYRDNAQRQSPPLNLVRNEAAATLYIYDVIDDFWGVSAADVVAVLDAIEGTPVLNVHINSPGGSVFEARAIMAALNRYPGKVIAHIDSLAASAATSIAMAADEVVISPGAFFMIHNASAVVWGDKNTLRTQADLLEKIEGSIVDDYTVKTGKSQQQVVDWMNAETWFNADEAVAHGFADRLAENAPKVENRWNLAAFSNAPEALARQPVQPQLPAPTPTPSMTIANHNRLALANSL